MSNYATRLREMPLNDIGRELFYLAKHNNKENQPKINAIQAELLFRDQLAKSTEARKTLDAATSPG